MIVRVEIAPVEAGQLGQRRGARRARRVGIAGFAAHSGELGLRSQVCFVRFDLLFPIGAVIGVAGQETVIVETGGGARAVLLKAKAGDNGAVSAKSRGFAST